MKLEIKPQGGLPCLVIDPTANAVGLQQRKPYYDQPECRI